MELTDYYCNSKEDSVLSCRNSKFSTNLHEKCDFHVIIKEMFTCFLVGAFNRECFQKDK